MKQWSVFLAMLQFLTRIPIRINITYSQEEFGKGLVYAPVIGLIIGGILFALYYIFQFLFPPMVSSVLIIVGYIMITGGLHLDGLGDTCDALFSHRSKERMLEIMRDSRIGTNALLGVTSILFLNVAILQAFQPQNIVVFLLLMPVAGRIGSLVSAGLHPYARKEQGLGKSFVDACGKKEIAIGIVLTIPIFYCLLGLHGIWMVFIPVVTGALISAWFAKKIDGVTGDVLGAVCEINQTAFLLVAFALSEFIQIYKIHI